MAPTCRVTARPSLNNAIVGIALIRKRRARFCASSVLTFATTHFPAPSRATLLSSGATILHGPHHGAPALLKHRKRDRLRHRSARPAWLVRCHISRSAQFRPACRISGDCAGHTLGRLPIRHGHPVVSSSSKTLSSQPTSVGRHLLWEKIRQQTSKAEH